VIALAIAAALAQAATPPPAPVAPQAAAQDTVQDIFEKRCIFCHGQDGRGQTKKGKQVKAPDFTSPKWNKETTDEEIKDAITNGVPKTKMLAFKNKLTPEQIDALAKYVRSFGKASK
jgi:mono/diheme cytochrome c family protein